MVNLIPRKIIYYVGNLFIQFYFLIFFTTTYFIVLWLKKLNDTFDKLLAGNNKKNTPKKRGLKPSVYVKS